MIVLVFLVSLGIVSTYQTARLAYLFWPDPVNPAALATAAAAFLGVTYLVQYLVKVHHPIWIRENIFQEVFARCSSLCRWDLRIGLGIGTFLISTLSTFGRSCLWFEHKLEDFPTVSSSCSQSCRQRRESCMGDLPAQEPADLENS